MGVYQEAYVNELLKIVVQVRKIILPSLIVRDELLLPLQQLLSLVLQAFALGPLVVDAREHEGVLVVVGVLGELREEILYGDEGELLVLVAIVASIL